MILEIKNESMNFRFEGSAEDFKQCICLKSASINLDVEYIANSIKKCLDTEFLEPEDN